MLYDRHSRAAYSLAYRMMNGRQAAEDLAQDAFLKVWRVATSYRADRGGVRTWILSIVHTRGIDQLRSSASRRRVQDRVEATTDRWQPSEAFAETWRNSQREQVREALDTVPPEQLKILALAYFSGYTHMEIAENLDVPLGTVKGRMRLGLKKLRDHSRPGRWRRRGSHRLRAAFVLRREKIPAVTAASERYSPHCQEEVSLLKKSPLGPSVVPTRAQNAQKRCCRHPNEG